MLEPSERLRNAVIEGNLPITKRLLARFPDLWLNANPHHKGWSNLHYASYHGHYLICFHLISFMNQNLGDLTSNYSVLDLLTFDDLSVLHLSVITKESQTLHYLLQEFPGKYWLDYAGGPLKQTPLHFSCVHGFKEGAKLLLEFGASWELQDSNGNTCLHLCLEFGNFDCIQVIFKYILFTTKNVEKSRQKIKSLEEKPNNKGWTAIEYASTFDLISKYTLLKNELFINFDLTRSDTITYEEAISDDNSTEENSLSSENRVLASPIVPVSMKEEGMITPTMSGEEPFVGRAHSQSLPNANDAKKSRRVRSNTTYTYKPPASINTNSPRAIPQTPNPNQRTPSLKSVTISPSVRSYQRGEEEARDEEVSPSSPSSLTSTLSSPVNSVNPSNGGRKKSFSFSNGPFSLTSATNLQVDQEDNSWPTIRSSPNHIIQQTLPESESVHAFQIPRSSRSGSMISSSSPSPVLRPQPDRIPNQELVRTASFHRQQSELSPVPTHRAELTKSRSSSASSIAAKVAFNSSRSSFDSPGRRPSFSNRSSSGGATAALTFNKETGEVSPVLRKTRSSGAIPATANSPMKSSSTITESSSTLDGRAQSKSSWESLSSQPSPTKIYDSSRSNSSRNNSLKSSNESLKRSTVNSISFSRVR